MFEQKTETVTETLPQYETPKIEVMTERDVLNTFQITQAMQTWWAACP